MNMGQILNLRLLLPLEKVLKLKALVRSFLSYKIIAS